MKTLKLKKGHQFRINGPPRPELTAVPNPEQVALLPSKIPHIKPRLKVSEGDSVRIGSLLFEDKRNPAFKFLSPGGGKVSRIQFGPRHSIEAIVINLDMDNEPRSEFPVIPAESLDTMDRAQLVDQILAGGMWWVFRELPFRDLPDPKTVPPRIIVSLSCREPFQPLASVYLKGQEALMDYGLRILNKLAGGPAVVCADTQDTDLTRNYGQWLTHVVSGKYPAGEAGVLNFHIKQSAEENRTWIINGQEVLLLARLLTQGRYPIERVVAMGGNEAPVQGHFRTRTGVPLSRLVRPPLEKQDVRWIVGGLMNGYTSNGEGYLGLRETALTMIPEGNRARFLALFNPGFCAPTYTRTFLSRINPNPLDYDGNLHGEPRACIACMYCVDVCPVDILPQMTYKAILAEEVEEYLEHGLLDCVECGLCSYVCPSKIELSQTFKAAKTAYAKEQVKPKSE